MAQIVKAERHAQAVTQTAEMIGNIVRRERKHPLRVGAVGIQAVDEVGGNADGAGACVGLGGFEKPGIIVAFCVGLGNVDGAGVEVDIGEAESRNFTTA